ncbi:MAG: ferric reductase-like transmembrane domain-containing protein [Propionibacteriaceae bacterium]|nr:ferric reductase-like transmembrane domain-containing protein [Propionibacteriaceae bacterium]
MKQGIAAITVMAAITVVTWAASTSTMAMPRSGEVAQLLGALALVTLAAILIIATRWRVVDRLFNGLDKAYVAHKWLGITTLILLGVHLITLHTADLPRNESALVHAGVPALLLFLVAIIFALAARHANYQTWKLVHLFVVVPYGLGVAHYYGASSFGPLGLSPFSLWMDLVNLAGVLAAIYAVVFFGRLGPRHKYVVTTCRPVADGILEITAQPVRRAISFKPGQFAFLTIPRLGFDSHPFTISSGTGDPLQFTVRALGDDTTRLVSHLRPGIQMTVAGPYGQFDPTTGTPSQIWVAAGIGITPFRSIVRTDVPDRLSVDLFYAYHGEAGGAYLDELRALNQPNLRVHLVNTAVEGRLTAPMIAARAPSSSPRDVYFCGPQPLRDALRASLLSSGAPVAGFHFEEFGFGRPTTVHKSRRHSSVSIGLISGVGQ